jgi:hypothetical protein
MALKKKPILKAALPSILYAFSLSRREIAHSFALLATCEKGMA